MAPVTGPVKSALGDSVTAEFTFENSRSTHFDALLFAPAQDPKQLKQGRLIHAVREAYMHLKAIGALGNAVQWVTDICLPGDFTKGASAGVQMENGVIMGDNKLGSEVEFGKQFVDAVAKHRVWDREVEHIAA